MPVKQTIDYDPTEEFVEEGRRALAEGRLEEARFAFEEVLKRKSDHPRALLGLAYIDRNSGPPPEGDAVLSVEMEIVSLVQERRYEEALDLLRRAKLERPDDEAVDRSLQHIRSHLEKKWRKQLGGDTAMIALFEPIEHPLASRIPGRLSELLEGDDDWFETLRTLANWKERGLLRAQARRPTPIFTDRGDALVTVEEKERKIDVTPNTEDSSPLGIFISALLVLIAGVCALWFLVR